MHYHGDPLNLQAQSSQDQRRSRGPRLSGCALLRSESASEEVLAAETRCHGRALLGLHCWQVRSSDEDSAARTKRSRPRTKDGGAKPCKPCIMGPCHGQWHCREALLAPGDHRGSLGGKGQRMSAMASTGVRGAFGEVLAVCTVTSTSSAAMDVAAKGWAAPLKLGPPAGSMQRDRRASRKHNARVDARVDA